MDIDKRLLPTLRPPYLQAGDTVGIFSPAKFIEKIKIDNAIQTLQSWGLKVVVAPHVLDTCHAFAGTDHNRAADMQALINNPDIKAIICSRGGYGCIRTLPYIDFSPLRYNPKWIVGYSDVTVYHSLLNCHFGIETLHATMPLNFPDNGLFNKSTESLRQALFGQLTEYVLPSHMLNITGKATGRLVGGNLSIIQSIAATPADIDTAHAILFIEEIDEHLYHIDRMMMNLKYGGKLAQLKAIIVGGMTDIKDNTPAFGMSAYELIHSYAVDAGIPIAVDFPAGHQDKNCALYMGRTVTLDVQNNGVHLSF